MVGTTALVSGIVTGVGEVVNQSVGKGAENINLLSVAISTAGGSIDGATVAGSLFTGLGGKWALTAGRTATSGLKSYLYGLSEGYNTNDITDSVIGNMGGTFTASLYMLNSKTTVLSLLFKPIITGAIKTLSAIGKNIWNHLIRPLFS